MWCHFVQSAQGDFKNIFMILQNKSLITGNYGLPVLELYLLTPSFLLPSLSTFIPPFCTRGQQGLEKRAYYLNVVHPTSRTPMFLFHSSGVVHFPAAITGHEIKTGPSGRIASPPADGCVRVNGLADGTWPLSALAEWLAEEIGKLTDWQHVIKWRPTVSNNCTL